MLVLFRAAGTLSQVIINKKFLICQHKGDVSVNITNIPSDEHEVNADCHDHNQHDGDNHNSRNYYW